jgi:hypothetical protein
MTAEDVAWIKRTLVGIKGDIAALHQDVGELRTRPAPEDIEDIRRRLGLSSRISALGG